MLMTMLCCKIMSRLHKYSYNVYIEKMRNIEIKKMRNIEIKEISNLSDLVKFTRTKMDQNSSISNTMNTKHKYIEFKLQTPNSICS
jgi:hypothetical protein